MRKPFLALALLLIPVAAPAQTTANDHFQAGVAAYQQNKMADSVASLKQAVSLDPSNWHAYQLMGNAYMKMNQANSALAAYDQSLRINPDNAVLKAYVDKLRASLPPEPVESLPGLSPSVASAAPKTSGPKAYLYLFGGASLPLYPNDFSNSRSIGYSGGFGCGLQAGPSFSFVFEALENYFALDGSKFPGLTITGGEVSNAMVLLNGKLGFGPGDAAFMPYGILGAGLSLFTSNLITAVNPSTQQTAVTPAVSETGFAYRLGLGCEVKVGNGTGLFLDVSGFGTTGAYSMAYSQARTGVKLDL
jgi:opacity protein-like surface antigen